MPIPTPSWLKEGPAAFRNGTKAVPRHASATVPDRGKAAAPRVLTIEERVTLERLKRAATTAGGALGALAIGALLWTLFYRGPTDCRKGSVRRAAIDKLLKQGDPISGLTVGSRYSATDFVCSDVPTPIGVLLSAHEGAGGVMIWFADERGDLRNVNLLAEAWTPRLDAAPVIPKEVLDRVER
ncbi:MAG: hypothetical protein NVS4B3_22260 [Gemmatimonadaceae bacterium]